MHNALHTGVKQAMEVVSHSFITDMEVVSHSFITDITKTNVENEERLDALMDEAEGSSERLAKLFESEVLPPEAGVGEEEGDAGGDDDQGL